MVKRRGGGVGGGGAYKRKFTVYSYVNKSHNMALRIQYVDGGGGGVGGVLNVNETREKAGS